MADFSKYTDMPLAANAADFAMEEYDPENPVMPECPFVTSFFQEGSFCDECYMPLCDQLFPGRQLLRRVLFPGL